MEVVANDPALKEIDLESKAKLEGMLRRGEITQADLDTDSENESEAGAALGGGVSAGTSTRADSDEPGSGGDN